MLYLAMKAAAEIMMLMMLASGPICIPRRGLYFREKIKKGGRRQF